MAVRATGMCGGVLSRPLNHSACMGDVSHPGHSAQQKCGPTRMRAGSRHPLDITGRRGAEVASHLFSDHRREFLKF